MSLSSKSFSLLQRDIFLFITNLITGIIVARKLGPEAMGLWIILQMIPAYAEVFGRVKFDIAVVYFLGKGKYGMGDVVFTINTLAIAMSIAIIVPVVWQFNWFYQLLFGNSKTNVQFLMYLILAQIPFHFLYMNYSYLLIYKEDVRTYNWMVIIRAIISSVIGISLLVFFNLGLLAVVSASIVAVFAAQLYGILKLGPIGKRKYLLNFPMIKDLLVYGFKLYLAGIIGYLNAYVTRLIVVLYLLPAQVAFFGMAQDKGGLINKVPNALSTILFPRIAKLNNNHDSAMLLARALRVVSLILIIIGFLALISIKPLVLLLYGQAYLPLVVPFWIILPGLILYGATSLIIQYFNGIGRADIIVKINIVPLIVQAGMALILIPLIGLVGAALALLVALLSSALIKIFVFLRISDCSLKGDLLIRKEDFQTVKSFILSQLEMLKTRLLKTISIRQKLYGFNKK